VKSTLLAILATLVLLVGAASAQSGVFAPYVDASIGGSSTFTGNASVTAHNPNYIVGAGIESSTKHLLLDVNGTFSTADYRAFGKPGANSFAGTITGTGYLKVGKLLLGGGTLYKDQVSNGNLKGLIPGSAQTFVPLVGGGFQFSRDRITAVYELPGRSATNQRTVDFHNEIFLTKSAHLRLTQDLSINTADNLSVPGVGTARVSGGQAAAGLKFVF
jgi:hypothetical protein